MESGELPLGQSILLDTEIEYIAARISRRFPNMLAPTCSVQRLLLVGILPPRLISRHPPSLSPMQP